MISVLRLSMLLLALLAAPAAAADLDTGWAGRPEPKPLPTLDPGKRAGGVLTAAKAAKARRGLGLPSYRSLLGKRWGKKVRAADAKFVKALTRPVAGIAQTTIPASIDDDPLKAKDVLRRGAERQKRTMRIAIAIADTCPYFQPGKDLGAFVRSKVRAEHVVTTVERVGRFDVTTIVTFDLQAEGSAGVSSHGVLGEPTADYGSLHVVREQLVRDRRRNKTSRRPLQTATEDISPLWVADGGFADFVARADDADAAPPRKLRTAVWDRMAQQFVNAVYAALVAQHKPSADKIATPNACVTLDVPAPERLAPGQKVTLTPVPKPTHMPAFYEQMMDSATVAAYYVDPQGATARSLIDNPPPAEGAPWFEVKAPPQTWPEERPFGITIRHTSQAGVAEKTVLFKPAGALPYRYRVLDASFNVHSSGEARKGFCEDFGPISGTRRVSGTGAPVVEEEPVLEQRYGSALRGSVFMDVPSLTSDDTTAGCRWTPGQGKIACTHTHDNRPGERLIGFSIEAESLAAETAKLHWAVPDPEIGFQDAGDDECYAHIWAARDAADDVQVVPMQKLLATDPQTFTFSGSKTWTADHAGNPAHLTQTWTYTVTIQRLP